MLLLTRFSITRIEHHIAALQGLILRITSTFYVSDGVGENIGS